MWTKFNPNAAKASDSTDAELVVACRRGDKRAFVEIVARYQAMACGIAFTILSDFAASEDAAQEAFLTAWRKIQDLREPERLRPWLAQIARNAALGQLRRYRDEESIPEHLPDLSASPDQAAVSEEENALVRAALERLPEKYRLPLVLFYREGQSVHAVASALGLSEDAVKQRLARGREMLREQMEGVLERVLTRTGPSAVFTMTIAAGMGALAAPSVLAAGVFSASAGATSTSSTIVSAMSTTKGLATTAAIVAAVCVPVGYEATRISESIHVLPEPSVVASSRAGPAHPSFEATALFAEWRALHERHGTNAAAMRAIFKEVEAMQDSVRKRAFRLALAAEWAAVDAPGGMTFLLGEKSAGEARNLFYQEWLKVDPDAAIDGLLAASDPVAVNALLRRSLRDIAVKAPQRVPELAARLPKSDSYWDDAIADAFAILAENHPEQTREIAEKLPGVNREAALAGVARAWGRTDIGASIAWARQLPAGTDRDEIVRATLIGLAKTDVSGALDRVSLVPPGGRPNYFATTTGARVLRQAAESNFEGTVAWLAANPGRLGREDMAGIVESVTDRLNADPVDFLTRHSNGGSLGALDEAIDNALLNRAAGLRPVVWDWLKQQPSSPTVERLRLAVLRSAAWQDPEFAFSTVKDLPTNAEGDKLAKELAQAVLNGGWRLPAFEQLYAQVPERIRASVLSEAFEHLGPEVINDPRSWAKRAEELAPSERERALPKIARAWAMKRPEEAAQWLNSIPPGQPGRANAFSSVATAWVDADERGAIGWITSLPPGVGRDSGTEAIVYRRATQAPEEALRLALTIGDEEGRGRALNAALERLAARDPAAARQTLEGLSINAETRSRLRETINSKVQR